MALPVRSATIGSLRLVPIALQNLLRYMRNRRKSTDKRSSTTARLYFVIISGFIGRLGILAHDFEFGPLPMLIFLAFRFSFGLPNRVCARLDSFVLIVTFVLNVRMSSLAQALSLGVLIFCFVKPLRCFLGQALLHPRFSPVIQDPVEQADREQ